MAFNFNQQTYYIDPATGQPVYIDPNENAAEANRLAEIENPWTLPKNLEITEANAAQAPGTSKGPKKMGMTGLPEAIGAVAGDVGALASSPYSKYSGAATGKAVGGGVGTALGSIIGMPQLGQQLGSLAGGLIGGASDQTKRRKDYDARTKQEFGMLNEQPNINPYGSSYMKQGGAVYGSTLERGPSFLDQYMTDIKAQSSADTIAEVDMNDPVSAAFARCGMMIKGKRYAKGGEVDGPGPKPKPIYVTDPRDPRLRMYNDSLLLHNQGNKAASELNKRMFSNAISNTEYLQWYDQNNDPKVEAAAARLTKANKQKPQPTGTTTPVDVYKNSGVIGQAATNLYKKPVQPVVLKKGQPTYADSLALYNKGEKMMNLHKNSRGIDYYDTKDLPIADISEYYNKTDGFNYRDAMDRYKDVPISVDEGMKEVNKLSTGFRSDIKPTKVTVGTNKEAYIFLPQYKKPVGTPKPKRTNIAAQLMDEPATAATPQLMGRRSPNVDVNKEIQTDFSYSYRTPEGGQKNRYFPDYNSWQDFMKDKTYTSQTVTADKSRASASGYYAMGGGVGDDPVYVEPKRQRREIYTTYGQINRDNAMAKDIMRRRINPNDTTQNYLAENAFVARNIGEPVVKFAYPGGKPAQPTAPLPLTLPSGVTIDQVENTSEGYGYWHPQNGNFIKVDPAIYGKYPKMEDGGVVEDAPFMKKGGKWIQKAVNPKHKGYCTPMTKSTCTPRRKALARTFKKHHGFHEDGGLVNNNSMKNPIQDIMYEDIPNDINYMAEGGYANESAAVTQQGQEGMQQGQKNLINVEKGELLVNPTDPNLEPDRYYDNPNRYSPHQKDPMKEPIGNFTMAEEGMVVIPKKYAMRFKNGDVLTRKSIIGEILKNQANNPEQNEPRTGNGAEFAATGMYTGGDPGPYKYVRGVGWVPDPKVPAAGGNQRPFGPAGLGANWLTNQVANYNNPTVDNPNMNYGAGNTVTPPPYIDPNEDAAEANRLAELASPWKLPKSLEITEQNAVPRVTPPVAPTGTAPKRNWNLIGAKVASGIGPAFGITQALGGDPFLRYDENYGFNDALAIAEGIETNPNMEASRAALNQALGTQNRVLNNIGSPSVRSEAGVNRANLLRSFGELSQNASNLSMDLRNKKRDTIANLKVNQGANRLDMRQRLMQELRMDQANRQSLVHQGLTEAATNFQQGVMDDERIKSINTMAEFYNIDPYQASMLLDQKKFLPYVQESADAMQRQIGRNLLARSANAKGQAGTPPFTTRNGQRFDANNNIVDSKGNIIK